MRDELRCPSRILAVIIERPDEESDLLEVKCSSSFCGAGRGAVVFHYFDLETSELVDTKKYKDAQEAMQRGRQ